MNTGINRALVVDQDQTSRRSVLFTDCCNVIGTEIPRIGAAQLEACSLQELNHMLGKFELELQPM